MTFGDIIKSKRIEKKMRLTIKYFDKLIPISVEPDLTIFEMKQKIKELENIEIEQQIDQLVYQLYDLTDEEIAIVEKASN